MPAMHIDHNPSRFDRFLRKLAGIEFFGGSMDIPLYWSVEKSNPAAAKRWLWIMEPRRQSRAHRKFSKTLLLSALHQIPSKGAPSEAQKEVALLMLDACGPTRDGALREYTLLNAAEHDEWTFLHQLARGFGISQAEASLTFNSILRKARTEEEHRQAYRWAEAFIEDPILPASFSLNATQDDQELVATTALRAALLYGNTSLLDLMLQKTIDLHDSIPSFHYSHLVARDKANPLSVSNVIKMIALDVEWADVLEQDMPTATDMERAQVLFSSTPELFSLVDQARDIIEAEHAALTLTLDTQDAAGEIGPAPKPRARRI